MWPSLSVLAFLLVNLLKFAELFTTPMFCYPLPQPTKDTFQSISNVAQPEYHNEILNEIPNQQIIPAVEPSSPSESIYPMCGGGKKGGKKKKADVTVDLSSPNSDTSGEEEKPKRKGEKSETKEGKKSDKSEKEKSKPKGKKSDSKEGKSEDIPEENNGPVKIVVRKNYDDLVTNSDKDVFLLFYIAGCGYCKQVSPVFEKVAEHFKNNKKLVFAKMNANKNELPKKYKGSHSFDGYPALVYIHGSNKNEFTHYGAYNFAELSKIVNDELNMDE